ncbi:MAG: bifunctional riboflavin kinase/FAD synthetase [Eubacteriales bacterium]|nr:bifunctional riboflavin kinase/FAD synthetase [Eubacteriales bacterium]
MSEVYDILHYQKSTEEQAIALGFFDGVHLGHQQLLKQLCQAGLKRAVFTFKTHPHRPENANNTFPGQIQTLEQRIACLSKYVDDVYLAPAVSEIMNLEPKEFIQSILKDKLNARLIVCGRDFHFGRHASGDVNLLAELASAYDYKLIVQDDVIVDGELLSSTRIRDLLKGREISQANALMGRAFAYQGEVREGKKLGRRLGCPTVNIQIQREQMVVAAGVYVSRVQIGDLIYEGVSNIGKNPTVDCLEDALVETFIYDFSKELYGREITVLLYEYLRPEAVFDSLDELKAAIAKDIKEAAAWHRVMRNKPCFF